MRLLPKATRKIHEVEFHRNKYGRELLVDVIEARKIQTFEVSGGPHVLRFYEIFLITHGSGVLSLDGRRYRVTPNMVTFTRPGQPRQWKTRDLDGLCLFFTADFVEEFLRDPLFLFGLPYFHRDGGNLRLALARDEAATLAQRLTAMQEEIHKLRTDSPNALRAGLYEVLIQLARTYRDKSGGPLNDNANATAVRLRQLIERHFRQDHQPAAYARRLRVTVGHLNQLARRHLGRSAGVVIRERLTLEAKRELAHTDLTAAEVAYGLGFKDPAYFARFFRRQTGVSPSAFRSS